MNQRIAEERWMIEEANKQSYPVGGIAADANDVVIQRTHPIFDSPVCSRRISFLSQNPLQFLNY